MFQGRPASLQEIDTLVPIEFLDDFEELEQWKPIGCSEDIPEYPGAVAHTLTTFAEYCKLSIILNRIINQIYTEKRTNRGLEKLPTVLETLHKDLEEWRKGLPPHLTVEVPKTGTIPPPCHILNLLYVQHMVTHLIL